MATNPETSAKADTISSSLEKPKPAQMNPQSSARDETKLYNNNKRNKQIYNQTRFYSTEEKIRGNIYQVDSELEKYLNQFKRITKEIL